MRSKNIASASAQRKLVVKSLDEYMSAPPDSTYQEISHSDWEESFNSCFGMTNMVDRNGNENPLNPNSRMVPNNLNWIVYEPDSKKDILTRKKVLQEREGFYTNSQMHDEHEMRNFTNALLTCLPFTNAFKPGGKGVSYCPLSQQMKGWREKHNLTQMCIEVQCQCKQVTAKQIYSHVCEVGQRCTLHRNMATYLRQAYTNYHGRYKHHRAIISSKKHKLEYMDACRTDDELWSELKEKRQRDKMYGSSASEYKYSDTVMKQSTSNKTSWYGPNKNADSSNMNMKYKSDESKKCK